MLKGTRVEFRIEGETGLATTIMDAVDGYTLVQTDDGRNIFCDLSWVTEVPSDETSAPDAPAPIVATE